MPNSNLMTPQGGEPSSSADVLSDEQVDQHLDLILRAAGSALRHYTMPKSRQDLRTALRRAVADLAGRG